ncbi:hypothetical protein F5887DRAFT_1215369 [Amanita rubescens]|nr:hypothetical protein F5887DRAFT_1215369 [Amanita rubescens]
MVSGILTGYLAIPDDLPGRNNSRRATLVRWDDPFSQFIEQQLFKRKFCIRTGARNCIAARKPILPESPPRSNIQASPTVFAWEEVLKSTENKTSMYKPLCKFLTLLAEKRFLFIPWDTSSTILGEISEERKLYHQDFVVVNAQSGEIDRFLNSELVLSQLPAQFSYQDENGEPGTKICYSDIQMVGEVKACDAPESPPILLNHAIHLLKYLSTMSRFQPQHACNIGILAYLDGFFIVDYYPDQAFFSDLFKWEDKDTAWNALRDVTTQVPRSRFMTKQFASLESTDRHGQARLQFNLLGNFGGLDAETYQLFDLHRGHVRSVDQKLNWNVIKHSWHDMRRRFDELDIFRKIYASSERKLCTAGIVRIDLDESRILDMDETPGQKTGESVNRQSILIVMKTLGKALSSCSSVMKFLKAMYDLVGINRMLVEEHQILHRDISWTNILIDAIHADEDSDNDDDLCNRPFIDVVLGVEGKMEVHATLSDFDCASILGSDKERESGTGGEIAGTPIFMAKPLCLKPARVLRTLGTHFKEACKGVFPEGVTGVNQRQDEVTAFLRVVDELGDKSDGARESVVHAPVHDAESIFWLIVLFFLRAWPKGYDPKQDPGGSYRRSQRNEIFGRLMKNTIGTGLDTRSIPDEDMLPPQLVSFAEMLSCLELYFLQVWHDLKIIGGQHRFHAHNAIQAVLLKEIKNLQTSGNDIELNPTPLGLDSDAVVVPDSSSYILKINAPDGTEDNVPVKKRKVLHKTDSTNADHNSTSSDDSRLDYFMSAINCNHDSKLWFMGDRDHVEYAFVQKAGPEREQKLVNNVVNW